MQASSRLRRCFVLFGLCALTSAVPAVEVINEDFEDGVIDGNLLNNSLIQDLGDGRGQMLSLTQGANGQSGFAWFNDSFNLRDSHVEIDLDFYLRSGISVVPADGMSVIFQFGNNTSATGGGGGGLGTSNFPSPYVSVAFDIWDNRESGNDAVDPPTQCFTPGENPDTRSCHVEVNQNANPGITFSVQTNIDLGVEAPNFIAVGDQLIPIHAKVVFDNGYIEVYLQTDGDPNFASPVKVISVALAAFPDPADAIIGFAASTGGANAHHEIDNLIVDESESRVTYAEEAPRSSGALNSAGPAVDATAEIGVNFDADRFYGAEVSRTGDLATGLVITRGVFGRVANGADYANTNLRPINVSKIPGAGAQTAKLFIDDAWSTTAVAYRARVVPGRYDVSLFWSENFIGAINGLGQGTKLYTVLLNGNEVLCNWSAASAAGSPTGSGDPNVTCSAVLDTGIRRSFSLDVPDAGAGFGVLDMIVDDLGGGNPPENAALNALSLSRSGNTTGGAPGGAIECVGKTPTPAPAGVLINDDYDAAADNLCPTGMACQGVTYVPQALAGRLRVTEDFIGNIAATANFEQTVDVCTASFRAEFEIFMAWEDDQAPADGGSFYVMQGNNINALGFGGGANGTPLDAYGFAVEFDTWDGCSFTITLRSAIWIAVFDGNSRTNPNAGSGRAHAG